MKKLIIISGILFLSLNINAQTPSWQWSQKAGGAANENGSSIAVDASGNSYVIGTFSSATITFGANVLTNSGSGTVDIFIVKYDVSGNVLWAKGAGGSTDDYGYGIAVDANGNSYVTGYFTSVTIAFDSVSFSSTGSAGDIFVVKYDASGNVLWGKSEGGASTEFGNSIAVDAQGNSYVTGSFQSPSITFGNTTLTNADNTGNTYDVFTLKYDPLGNILWAKSAGGTNDDQGYGITVDTSGNSFITGFFRSSAIVFDSTTLTNAGVFVVKYNTSGNAVWAKNAGGSGMNVNGKSIGVDVNGNSYITGFFKSPSITFGSFTLTNDTTTNSADVFVVKYSPSGNVLWAKSAGGGFNDMGYGISIGATGNAYITGYFRSHTITFGSTTLTNKGPNTGDIFVVKYDELGNVIWAKSVGAASYDYGNSISVDEYENSYLTGFFQSSTIPFGTDTLTNADNSGNTSDFFIVKICQPLTPIITANSTTTFCQGNTVTLTASSSTSYLWSNGTTTTQSYTVASSGSYSVTVNANGCSASSAVTNVTVSPVPATPTISQAGLTLTSNSAVDNQWYLDGTLIGGAIGQTYSATLNGTYTVKLITTGCASGASNPLVITSVGIEENSFDSGLFLYPNPSSGIFSVKSETKIVSIEITNNVGEIILEQQINSTQTSIDLSKQAKGFYFVKVFTGDNNLVSKKIVIQ